MKLTISQQFEIEQAIIKGRQVQAIKRYREFCDCDLNQAKQAVEDITRDLQRQKPWLFRAMKSRNQEQDLELERELPLEREQIDGSKQRSRRKPSLIGKLFQLLAFGLFVVWFLGDDLDDLAIDLQTLIEGEVADLMVEQRMSDVESERRSAEQLTAEIEAKRRAAEQRMAQAEALKQAVLPKTESVSQPRLKTDSRQSQVTIPADADFVSLYRQKLNDPGYITRKSSKASRSIDETPHEVAIKAYRSQLAAMRELPDDKRAYPIGHVQASPLIDGVISPVEWDEASIYAMTRDERNLLYLQNDGEWLYVACDAKDEITAAGYDQLRVYLHAGLIPEMVNERVHLGASPRVTSIRQTTIRWQGDPPDSEAERWKKYNISDWGIYRYASGVSGMGDHRQYEIAIHLGEAGLHPGVPFTFFVELETDPLKDDNGKFKQRRFIARLGSQESPFWMLLE